ncbi:hypothetical protein I79_018556 [Cricetulus griseus]|uniref:Uncharacterized protein n=1 Tax=Cricetulus griseus TaxID=10029 RepID=G3I515_CRIGR|nr:hypothetical protein I79_018556 [Cricetulus griseus]
MCLPLSQALSNAISFSYSVFSSVHSNLVLPDLNKNCSSSPEPFFHAETPPDHSGQIQSMMSMNFKTSYLAFLAHLSL